MNYIPTSWNPWLCVRLAIIPYLSTQVHTPWVQYTCTRTLSALRTGYRQLRGLSPPADTFLSLERNLDPSQASWPVHSNCVVVHALPCLTCKQDCMPTNSKHWAKSHSRSIHAKFSLQYMVHLLLSGKSILLCLPPPSPSGDYQPAGQAVGASRSQRPHTQKDRRDHWGWARRPANVSPEHTL